MPLETKGVSRLTGVSRWTTFQAALPSSSTSEADVRISPLPENAAARRLFRLGDFQRALCRCPNPRQGLQGTADPPQLLLSVSRWTRFVRGVSWPSSRHASRWTVPKIRSSDASFLRRPSSSARSGLPNTAFKKNAHTEVTTDVIFLRKLDAGEAPTGENWVDLVDKKIKDEQGQTVTMALNSYYRPEPRYDDGPPQGHRVRCIVRENPP